VGATTAYVGFSGGDGSVASTQRISDFAFVSLPVLTIQPSGNNQIVITWSAAVGGYTLPLSPAISPASWTSVSNTVTTVSGLNQVTLPAPASHFFYRLINSP
jgi:hypothetical protein